LNTAPTIKEQFNLHCTTFTEYDKTFKLPVAFATQDLSQCIGEYISNQNLKQFRTAETEKYAHVTFFPQWWEGRAVSFGRKKVDSISQGENLR
jgi:bisphosphoglycerate-independent phosphoglycerate mutase (AlkP superfamily)